MELSQFLGDKFIQSDQDRELSVTDASLDADHTCNCHDDYIQLTSPSAQKRKNYFLTNGSNEINDYSFCVVQEANFNRINWKECNIRLEGEANFLAITCFNQMVIERLKAYYPELATAQLFLDSSTSKIRTMLSSLRKQGLMQIFIQISFAVLSFSLLNLILARYSLVSLRVIQWMIEVCVVAQLACTIVGCARFRTKFIFAAIFINGLQIALEIVLIAMNLIFFKSIRSQMLLMFQIFFLIYYLANAVILKQMLHLMLSIKQILA